MATIKDVARRAGVSVCTASRVLSNKGYLKEATKEKVLEAVKELGYVQNRTATELKTGVSDTIAILLPDIENPFYSHFANVIEKYAYAKGYLLFICSTAYDLEKEEKFLRSMSARNIRGVIAVPLTADISNYRKYLGNVPLVIFNRDIPDNEALCYKVDIKHVAFEVTSHLIDIGRRNIGCIFQSFEIGNFKKRYEGARESILKANIEFREENMIFDAGGPDTESKLRKLFSRKDRPDAIFASNDMLAFMVYKVLNELGLSIPSDVAVASIDDTLMADQVYPTLTSYSFPIEEIARLIIDGFAYKQHEYTNKILKGQLEKRMSTAVDHKQKI